MCTSPIWIKNPRFFKSKDAQVNRANEKWDWHRAAIAVPCGHCAECIRQHKADWYVRLNREFAYQRSMGFTPVFITITIDPRYYENAIKDLSAFVRSLFESVRHQTGKSVKHALFSEFGAGGRLHLHGFLFGIDWRYSYIRKLFGRYGYVWLAEATVYRARYTVKYVVKDAIPAGISDDPVAIRRFNRKYISAGVGNYLGNLPSPSVFKNSWVFLDRSSGKRFTYRIPRYYDKYLSDAELETRRCVRSYVSAKVQALPYFVKLVERRFDEVAGLGFLQRNRDRLKQLVDRTLVKLKLTGALDPPCHLSRLWEDFELREMCETAYLSWLQPLTLVTS